MEFKYQHQKDLLLLKPDYGYINYVYTLERINDKQGAYHYRRSVMPQLLKTI